MRRSYRLTRTRDFERAKSSGKSVYHRLLILVYVRREHLPSRIAVVASKAVGGAVVRNSIKRRLRACLNELWENIAEGWDLVFFSRPDITQASYKEICTAIEHLLKKADVWQDTQ